MGKDIPRGFEKIRSGEQIQIPSFTNVAAAVAAGVTVAKFPRRIIHLSAGGTGSVPCLAISDGTADLTQWTHIGLVYEPDGDGLLSLGVRACTSGRPRG